MDGDTDTARPIVPVRKVRRRVNYEEWRERESACARVYIYDRSDACCQSRNQGPVLLSV